MMPPLLIATSHASPPTIRCLCWTDAEVDALFAEADAV